MPSISSFSGVADEHNFESLSPVLQRPPLPVAEAEPTPQKVLVSVPRRVGNAPEAKRVPQPQQWTGLSSQLSDDYQHDDEHAEPVSPARLESGIALEPAAQSGTVVEPTASVPRPSVPIKLKPKVGLVRTSPLRPKQWRGVAVELAEEFPLANDEEVARAVAATKEEAYPVRAEQPSPTTPSTAPTGPEVRRAAVPLASASAGLEPLQWSGLSDGLASSEHNMRPSYMVPSPENNRQRQRRISREIAEAHKAAESLAVVGNEGKENQTAIPREEERFHHARPTEQPTATPPASTYFDFSPISLVMMGTA